MEIEHIKNFINNRSEKMLSPKQVKLLPLAILWLLFLASFFSITSENTVYIWIMWALFVPYLVSFLIISKKTYANRLLLLGTSSLMLSASFLILSFIFVDLLGRNVAAYKWGIILSLFLTSLIFCIVRLNTIKNLTPKKSSGAKNGTPPTAIYAGISVLGIAFARTVFGKTSQDLAIKVVILLSAGMAMLFSLGIDPLLKYYFCRKYKIDIE